MINVDDVARVAAAVRKLIVAAPAPGTDCAAYATWGQHLLRRLGVAASATAGHAAWRVGVGVVISSPAHAWIEADGMVIDFTKPFLMAEKHEIASTFAQVAQGRHYYERVPTIEAEFRAARAPPQEYVLDVLMMIYRDPSTRVFGPEE